MVTSDLVLTLRSLSRSEKYYVMQLLITELAQQEPELIKPNQAYPVWSPYDANDAATAMLDVLKTAQTEDHD